MQTISREQLAGILRQPGGFGNSPGGWAGGAGSPVPPRRPRQFPGTPPTAYGSAPMQFPGTPPTAYSGVAATPPGRPAPLDVSGATPMGGNPAVSRRQPTGGFGNSPGGWAGGAGSPVPARNPRPQQFPGQMPWAYNRT